MKILPAEVDSFIANKLQNFASLMLYGPDLGLIKERAKYIANYLCANANFELIDVTFTEVFEIEQLLYTKSFAKSKKLIKISDIGVSLPKELSEIISQYKGKNFILIEAQDLSPGSLLRKFFEKTTNVACVACYVDEPLTIKNLILNTIKKHDLQITPDALQTMTNAVAGDRMLIINNINKLITYMGNKKQVEIKDVVAVIEIDREEQLDELAQFVANKNSRGFCATFANLLEQNVFLIAILRALARHFLRIYEVKLKVAENVPIMQAMQELSPLVFFKQVNVFKLQVQNWKLGEIASFLALLLKLEMQFKKTTNANELLLEYHVLQFIHSSR